jgi:hypothetical protein
MLAVAVSQFDGFSGSLSEEVELCPSGLSASYCLNVDNVWRMQRENSLNTFVAKDAADGETLVHAATGSGNDCAGEQLNACFFAFGDPAMDVNGVAYLEIRNLLFEALTFN